MSYSSFKFKDLRKQFAIVEETDKLFDNILPVQPTELLKNTLLTNSRLPLLSEKAKSELIISPILIELWKQNNESFTIFSGVNLDADIDKGLNGECDFIISSVPGKRYSIISPIFIIVEAKNDNIASGLPQCIAQMLGAKIFNEKDNNPIETIYGCVTTGQEWQFIKLVNNKICIDDKLYFLSNLDRILGILQLIVKSVKQ